MSPWGQRMKKQWSRPPGRTVQGSGAKAVRGEGELLAPEEPGIWAKRTEEDRDRGVPGSVAEDSEFLSSSTPTSSRRCESSSAGVVLWHILWLLWVHSKTITPEASCERDPGSQPGPQSFALAPRHIYGDKGGQGSDKAGL